MSHNESYKSSMTYLVGDGNAEDADDGGNLDKVMIEPPPLRRVLHDKQRRRRQHTRVTRIHIITSTRFNNN